MHNTSSSPLSLLSYAEISSEMLCVAVLWYTLFSFSTIHLTAVPHGRNVSRSQCVQIACQTLLTSPHSPQDWPMISLIASLAPARIVLIQSQSGLSIVPEEVGSGCLLQRARDYLPGCICMRLHILPRLPKSDPCVPPSISPTKGAPHSHLFVPLLHLRLASPPRFGFLACWFVACLVLAP